MNIKIKKLNKSEIPITTKYLFGTVANDKLCQVSKGDYDIFFDIGEDTYMINLTLISTWILQNKDKIDRLNKLNNLL
jgi:hypothetical protein